MKTIRKRRRENKTDYSKRIKSLKGETPRIVVRKSNRYILAQYVTSKEAQDKVEISKSSKELLKYGWPKKMEGSLKSIPASYLLGILIGKKISREKSKKAVVDFGMMRMLHKNKLYAVLKGLVDAGIDIKCKKELFPSEDRIKGKHLKEDFTKTFEEIKSKVEMKNDNK